MKIERDFIMNGVRYEYDEGMCSSGNGYAQVDTREDAHYFGIWTNPFDYKIVMFMEGDLVIQTAESLEEYVGAVRELKAAYGNHESTEPYFGIDPMLDDRLKDRFHEIGLTELLHASCQ